MEAEQAVLGAILLNDQALRVSSQIVSVEHFYHPAHKLIYQAMVDVHETGEPIDPVTVGGLLKDRGQLVAAGGAMLFTKLTDSVATVANVETYARIVQSKAAVRRMLDVARQIVADGYKRIDNVEEYLANARTSITAAASGVYTDTGPILLSDGMDRIIDDVVAGEYPPGLVKTGIGDLDLVTGGLWPGLMTILAGRPAMGKSAAALNMGINAALQGRKVLYVTLEDVHYFVVLRSLARFADMDYQQLVLRDIESAEGDTLRQAGKRIDGLPFWVSDASSLSSARIRQLAAAHANLHGLDLLIVDHLAEVDEEGENETAMVTHAAQAFRDCAKELNIPALVVHQLNRNVEHRGDKRPTLSDLRQSGGVEQVARSVWFSYRPHYYNEDADAHEFQLIVAKANHGRTGTVKLWCDLSRMYITDRSNAPAYRPPPPDERPRYSDDDGPRIDPSLGLERTGPKEDDDVPY